MNSHWGNLIIGSYKNKNIDPLMPILQQEFPNWNSKRIKSYMDLVNNENSEVSGVLAAKNESGYYVGCLIYTYQQIDQDKFSYPSDNFVNLSYKNLSGGIVAIHSGWKI